MIVDTGDMEALFTLFHIAVSTVWLWLPLAVVYCIWAKRRDIRASTSAPESPTHPS